MPEIVGVLIVAGIGFMLFLIHKEKDRE